MKKTTPDSQLLGYYNTMMPGKTFANYQEMAETALQRDEMIFDGVDANPSPDMSLMPNLANLMISITPENQEDRANFSPYYVHSHYYRDTSVGGNDVINPLPQFSIDDDIIHPLDEFDAFDDYDDEPTGLGRVYREMYQENQQILEIAFGVTHYNGYAATVMNATSSTALNAMQDGDLNAWQNWGHIFGEVVKWGLMIKPIAWAGSVAWNWMTEGTKSPVSKFVEFESSMFSYYRIVHTMLSNIAQGMGLLQEGEYEYAKGVTTEQEDFTEPEKYHPFNYRSSEVPVPEIIKNSCSIFSMLDKRAALILGLDEPRTLDDMLDAMQDDAAWTFFDVKGDEDKIKTEDGTSPYDSKLKKYQEKAMQLVNKITGTVGSLAGKALEFFWREPMTRFTGAGAGNLNFVRFRVNAADNASESFSNSVGEHPLGSQLKDVGKKGLHHKFVMEGMNGLPGANIFKGMMDMAREFTAGTVPFLGGDIKKGNAMVDMPEVWQESSTQRSYNFTINLEAPYGDKVSIFQSLYVPMVMLLAGALPRQVGKNTYTSPFVVKAHCKGQFSIPYGIIDNISVKRGKSEFGWSSDGHPLAIEVTFSIRDLTPVMYMGALDGGKIRGAKAMLSANESLLEYVDTLAGLGMSERYNYTDKVLRRARIATRLYSDMNFTPAMWGRRFGLSGFGQTLMSLTPWGESAEGAKVGL